MKNDSFYKTLRIVCLILAIVCMALSLFKKVKAEELPEVLQNQIIDILDNDLNISINQTYLDNCFSCPYCSVYVINNGYGDIYYFDFYFTKNIGYLYQRYDGRYYYATSMYFEYNWSDRGYISCSSEYNGDIGTGYRLMIDGQSYYFGSVTANSSNPVNSTNFNIKGLQSSYSDIYGYNVYSNSTRSYSYNVLISYGNCYLQHGNTFAVYPDTYTPPPSVNTEGFEVYKYGSSGSERLVCDFTKCISISNAVGNSSTIQINLTIDGVDQTFNFDSTSSYYDYSVESWRAIYSFPFSVFGINSETISARLTGVDIINITSSPGGSTTKHIVWVTPLTLVGSDYEDLYPEVIPDAPDYTLNVNNQQYYDYIEDKITSSWVEDVTQSDVHNYVDGNTLICAYQRGYTWADWWNDWSGFFANVQDIPTYIFDNSPSSTDEFKKKMMDFLKNNYGSLYFDTVIITWDPRNGELPLIYVWKTHLYQLKNTNSILKDMSEYLNISAFYTKQSYFDIKGRLDDFEDKTLTKLNELVGLQELENGFISSLQSILNQILNALLNLNIEIPEADYSSITSRLDQLISNQGNGNLNNDWYDNYRSWLYGKDSTDNIIFPHEFFIEIFDPIKNTYAAFIDNSNIAGYIADMDLFVEYISGKIDDNLSIYFKDGIGSSSFDINDNNMLTVGGI